MPSARNPQFPAFDTEEECRFWSPRVAQYSHVFPKSYKDLEWDEEPAHQERFYSFALGFWNFLEPFFASRGYTMYVMDTSKGGLVPKTSPQPSMETRYPFSRVIQNNKPTEPFWGSFFTWPARDCRGHDVMIKAISDTSEPSNELQVMLRLNEKALRSDPFNHTVFALEFLTFNGIVFVVMPRWDAAFAPDFATVSELMQITKTFLEVFVFLHHHRIVHLDFLPQNTGMNVVMHKSDIVRYQGLRTPGQVRYTLYDFGNALIFPRNTIIENVVETRPLSCAFPNAQDVEGPYNPFKADMAFLGFTLQTRVRHIENIVPQLGPFFDRLVGILDPTQFTARQALDRFMEIYNSLSMTQLQAPVYTYLWQKGMVRMKYNRNDG